MTNTPSEEKSSLSWLERLGQAFFAGEPKDKTDLMSLLRFAQQRDVIDKDTLPMIEALSNTNHPDHPLLETLSRKTFLQVSEVQTIANILREMGTIDACRRMARAYQVQAAAAFSILPELEPFFRDYITPEF